MNESFSWLGGNIQPALVVDDSDANAIRDQIYITHDLNCGIERQKRVRIGRYSKSTLPSVKFSAAKSEQGWPLATAIAHCAHSLEFESTKKGHPCTEAWAQLLLESDVVPCV